MCLNRVSTSDEAHNGIFFLFRRGVALRENKARFSIRILRLGYLDFLPGDESSLVDRHLELVILTTAQLRLETLADLDSRDSLSF